MESNLQKNEGPSNDGEKDEMNDLNMEKATILHEFSSPWDDSDLVLVVEDQKLHVHRMILKMASPVFKAMLSSDFKERGAAEITLPGKKVNEFIDLLRQIYLSLESEITLKNIEHIYRLADEYQMTRPVKDCRLFLASLRKTKENAMDMLLLAQVIGSDEARQQCYDVLQQMTLTELEKQEGFTDLDGPSMRTLLLPVVKRLQKCVRQTLPELVGALDCMLFLWCNENNVVKMGGVPNTCPNHKLDWGKWHNEYRNHDFPETFNRIKCNACLAMFKQMASNTHGYGTPSNMYLSENIVIVLEEMMNLLKD